MRGSTWAHARRPGVPWYRLVMTRPRALLAVSAALAAAVVYAVMWVGYLQDCGWLRSVDWSLLTAAHDAAVKHPAWVGFWSGVSFALGPVPLRALRIGLEIVAGQDVMEDALARLLENAPPD